MGTVDDMITMKQAAEILRKNHVSIRRWIRAGRIKSVKIGNLIYFTREEIDRVMREGI